MINRILFFILTKIYRVDPYMVNPMNWRLAHSYEMISRIFGCRPIIYKARNTMAKYGFENFVFLINGQIYLTPIKIEDEKLKELNLPEEEYGIPCYMPWTTTETAWNTVVQFTLLKHYMDNDPYIVVKKFPTKLLIILLKRHIKQQTKHLKFKENENQEYIPDVDSAVRSDLSESYECKLPEL